MVDGSIPLLYLEGFKSKIKAIVYLFIRLSQHHFLTPFLNGVFNENIVKILKRSLGRSFSNFAERYSFIQKYQSALLKKHH